MAKKNLQSLVLPVAFTSDRATGLERNVRFAAMGNPANALSLPSLPRTGLHASIGPEPGERVLDYSMDAIVRRAGRSASVGVGSVRALFARTRMQTSLIGWRCDRGTTAKAVVVAKQARD
jgi:hypothetical protein